MEFQAPVDVDKYIFKEYAAQFMVPNANITFQREPIQASLHDADITKDAISVSSAIVAYAKGTFTRSCYLAHWRVNIVYRVISRILKILQRRLCQIAAKM